MAMKNLIIILAATIMLWGCGDSNTKQQSPETPSPESTEKPESPEKRIEHEEVASFDRLTLNDGKKWKMTEEMMPIVIEAQDALFEFAYENYNEYNYLGERLNNYNYSLINNCNMKGPSHDALHHWLVPHMELTDALEKAENAKEADRIIEELQESFRTFHVYFE